MTQKTLKLILFDLVKQARADAERQFAKAGIAITPFEYRVLYLIKHQPTTLADIAKRLEIKAPSAVPCLVDLEKQGLIIRQPDSADRRKIQLEVTAKGNRLLANIMKDHPADRLHQAFLKLSKPKQQQLLTLLQELSNNFTK